MLRNILWDSEINSLLRYVRAYVAYVSVTFKIVEVEIRIDTR